MKITAIAISLACLSPGLLAAEEPSPSPTPIFRNYAPHSAQERRLNYFERKHESEARGETAQAKAQARADRTSAAATQAQTKAANRARTQAQRQVATETRSETRKEIPRTNSDLMSRMGFSEEEIAAQKAREQPGTPVAKETTDSTFQTQRPQEQSIPNASIGAPSDHPILPHAKADTGAAQQPVRASPAPDPESH